MKFKFLLSEQDTSELKDKDQTLYVINNYADNTKQKYANIDPQLIDKLRASDLGRGSIVIYQILAQLVLQDPYLVIL